WLRYSSNALFQYSAEILAFATTPWILLSTIDLVERSQPASQGSNRSDGRRRWFLVGVLGGCVYWIKYSSVFVTGSVIAFLWIESWGRDRRWQFASAVAGCAVPILALSAINRAYGGAANMFTAWHELRLSPDTLVYAAGNPALMAADADSLLQYLLTNPAHGLWRDRFIVAALGVPGGVAFAWLALRAERPIERLPAVTLFVTMALMTVAWIGSSAVSFEARHVAGASMAALPAVLAIGTRRWETLGRPARLWLPTCGVAYAAGPG